MTLVQLVNNVRPFSSKICVKSLNIRLSVPGLPIRGVEPRNPNLFNGIAGRDRGMHHSREHGCRLRRAGLSHQSKTSGHVFEVWVDHTAQTHGETTKKSVTAP